MPNSFGTGFRAWMEGSEVSDAILGVVAGGNPTGEEEKSHLLSRSTADFSSSIRSRLKDLGVLKSVPRRSLRIEISKSIDDGVTVGDLIRRVSKASSLTEGRYESDMDALSAHADPAGEMAGQEPSGAVSRPGTVRGLRDRGLSADEAENVAQARFGPKKTLVIMRGVSGSGKSTAARRIAAERGGVILSTDDFFEREGRYDFDPKMLPANHRRNQERAEEAMERGVGTIIIDNTNTEAWEMRPYVVAAMKNGYEVEIVEPGSPGFPEADFDEIMRRQRSRSGGKSMPEEVVRRMAGRYQRGVTVQDILDSRSPLRP